MYEKSDIIKSVVGVKTYNVWIAMLQTLVPHGRTHRLSVVVGGMLQFTCQVAYKKEESCPKSRKFLSLYRPSLDDREKRKDRVIELTEALFNDAGVRYKRVNSRGQDYSIAESAAYQFMDWENMPWE
jgi:hypothetical protein